MNYWKYHNQQSNLQIEQQFNKKRKIKYVFIKYIKINTSRTEIELDGGYAYCCRCFCEIEPSDNICPKCGQSQDWS